MKTTHRAVLLLTILAAASLAQYGAFGSNKVRDTEMNWRILATEHFDVYFYGDGEEVVGVVAEMAEAAWKQLREDLGNEPTDRIPFILYNSQRDFRQTNVTLSYLPEGVGGFSEPLRNRIVIPYEGSQPLMYEVIVHELTHVFNFYSFFRDVTGELLSNQIGTPDFWFMEGLPSHEARQWDTDARMVLRDAVLSDNIVPLEYFRNGAYIPGYLLYLAYKEGHSAVDFFVERYGEDKLPELIRAVARTDSRSVSEALEQVIDKDLDEFTEEWTIHLKRRFWVDLVEGRRPEDFSRRITDVGDEYHSFLGPRLSPSGDLVAVIANLDRGAHLYLLDAKEGRQFARLTSTGDFDYLSPSARSVAFDPAGDTLAVIAKDDRWQGIYLIDVVSGEIYRVFDELNLDTIDGLCFSADGEELYLTAQLAGIVDIFSLDTGTGALERLTDSPYLEAHPAASPDGERLAFALEEEDGVHLAELDLDSGEIIVLTAGPNEDRYPDYHPDGERIAFSSDRVGPSNIFCYDRRDGSIVQLTDSLRDIYNPDVAADGTQIAFNSYQQMTHQVHIMDLDLAVDEPFDAALDSLALEGYYDPPIRTGFEVGDLSKIGTLEPWEYDLEIDAGMAQAEYTTGGAFRALGLIIGSDTLGDHRLFVQFGLTSVSSLDDLDLDVAYYWMKHRPTYGARAFTWKDYYLFPDGYFWERLSGGQLTFSYPFTEELRVDANITGYEQGRQYYFYDGSIFADYRSVIGPGASLVYDSTEWYYTFPVRGVRLNLGYQRPSAFMGSDWEYNYLSLDFRGYLNLYSTAGFALRVYSGLGFGGDPYDPDTYLGGALDLRGYDYTEFVGNNIAFANLELRLPLIDRIDFGFLPGFILGNFRGVGFIDAGVAWDNIDREIDFTNLQLWTTEPEFRFVDLKASIGMGLRWDSLGLPLRFDWAWPWNGRDFEDAKFHFSIAWEF